MFFVVLSVFFVVLTVSTVAGIYSKVKESKYIGRNIESISTISVTETGEVYSKPDLAIIDFSVVTEAKTASGAMEKNAETMNKVIDAVKAQAVEAKDLKTIYFNLYPLYEYQKEECLSYSCPSGKRILVGYEVQQQLQTKIRDLAKIGDIIEGATTAGANQVGDLQLTIDNQDELEKQARTQAIDKAKSKAENLVLQLGVKLVRIASFSESSYIPFYGLEKAMAVEGGFGGAAPAPTIETGENKITVTVTITFEIR